MAVNEPRQQNENLTNDYDAFTYTHRSVSNMKMKPQTYSGEEDLQDFLTQFEITAEINIFSKLLDRKSKIYTHRNE